MPNLQFGGVGNTYTMNNLSDAPHSGIFGGGNAAPWGDPPVTVSSPHCYDCRRDADFFSHRTCRFVRRARSRTSLS